MKKASDTRTVLPGDRVFFWMPRGGKLECQPAWIDSYLELSNRWILCSMERGRFIPRVDIAYSDTPEPLCWTFDGPDPIEPFASEQAVQPTFKTTVETKKSPAAVEAL